MRMLVVCCVAGLLVCSGCLKPRITLFPDTSEPLKEYTIQGGGREKILMIPIKGLITDTHKGGPFFRKPSMVQEIVSQLKKAEKDKGIKAVILKIDTPGGPVTASDILYHEIRGFRERCGVRVVAAMMGVAASGGYLVALPADLIMAHPTSITGSIGVVFLRPNVSGLMGKIGLEMQVDKSGRNKDMGSPFRKPTGEEQEIVRSVVDDLASRFLDRVVSHRKLDEQAREDVSSARIYAAPDALRLGLVDRLGYLDDAIKQAIKIADLPEDARVVVYRRTEYPDDNVYSASGSKSGTPEINLINLDLAEFIPPFSSGFYYLWLPNFAD
jgi:protease-4